MLEKIDSNYSREYYDAVTSPYINNLGTLKIQETEEAGSKEDGKRRKEEEKEKENTKKKKRGTKVFVRKKIRCVPR